MQPGFRWLFPVPSSPLYMLQPSYRPRVFLESMGISSNSPQRCCSEAGPLRDLEDGTTKMREMQAEGDPPPPAAFLHIILWRPCGSWNSQSDLQVQLKNQHKKTYICVECVCKLLPRWDFLSSTVEDCRHTTRSVLGVMCNADSVCAL